MEICGGRETQPDSEEQEKEQIANSYWRVLPCSLLPCFSLFQSLAMEEAKKDKRTEDLPPTETVAAGEVQDEES